jgi:serine/threonine protein kinase
VWLIIIQLTDVLSHCTKLGFWHYNIRPDTVFVREDHKTLCLSYFGKAKFIEYYSKDSIRYLAPTVLAQMESAKNESDKKRTSKDDVFSVGYTIAEMCLTGAVLPYVTALNKDSTGDNLNKILNKLQEGGYSKNLLNFIEQACQYEEANRPDFVQLYA